MTPPPRARVSWKDGRPPTIVYLQVIHRPRPFVPGEHVFWHYTTFAGEQIGPGMHPTREYAWAGLREWAADHDAEATPFPVPEGAISFEARAEDEEEMPDFYHPRYPAFDPEDREPESREDREERMEGM